MSYDLWLEADLGGHEPITLGHGRNMTSNVACMWRKAGADLAEFDGKVAQETIPVLRAAIQEMQDNRAEYEAMNPSNGWGDAEGCLGYLSDLLVDALSAPKAVWRVSR